MYQSSKKKRNTKKENFKLPLDHRTPREGYGKYNIPSEKEVGEERLFKKRIEELLDSDILITTGK